MNRAEYLSRAREFAARGADLPQSKLNIDDVEEIKSAVLQRDRLRKYIRESLSNQALAAKLNVHIRTIEKVVQLGSWTHV